MNKKSIITILLALVAVAGQAEGQRSIVHRTSHEARVVGCQCREPSSFVGHLFRVSSLSACKDTAFCVSEKVYGHFSVGRITMLC